MRKHFAYGLLCGVALTAAAAAGPAFSDMRINGTLVTPARISFETEPNFKLIPGTHVYYYEAPDQDIYRLNGTWYVNSMGTWYRGAGYRGPFVQVSSTVVPRSVMTVPVVYQRHGVKVIRSH
jgi:hypothetical protein